MQHLAKLGALGASLMALALAISTAAALAQDAKPIAVGKSMVDSNIRIEVEELKRTGDGTVMLKFEIVNDSAQDRNNAFLGADSLSDVRLLDLVNRRQYEVGRKDIANTLSSTFPGVKAMSRTQAWALYGAPPQGVTKLTVMLPNFYPIDDVPLGN